MKLAVFRMEQCSGNINRFYKEIFITKQHATKLVNGQKRYTVSLILLITIFLYGSVSIFLRRR